MSLSNTSKEQFMNRSGSYSTHGSRRGFSTLGEKLRDSDLHSLDEQREIVLIEYHRLLLIKKGDKTNQEKARMDEIKIIFSDIKAKKKKVHGKYFNEDRHLMNKGTIFQKVAKEVLSRDEYMAIAEQVLDIMADLE